MTVNVDIDMNITEPSEIDMAVTQSADTVDFELGAEAIPVKNHAVLENRDLADQHPISAITGLTDILSTIPTKTSQLTNDSGFITSSDIPSAPVSSVNGKTGVVVLGASDVGALPSTYTAPVTSVNGQTGAVTVTEGLAPLIGTTEDILPSQVASAITEGRDVAISHTDETFGELVFTAFNKTVMANALVANTIAYYNSTLYLFELYGALSYGIWQFAFRALAQIEDLANYVPTSRTINNKALSSNITLSASDVSAIGTSALVTSVSASSTNSQVPSAKCLYDIVGNVETLLASI